MTFFEPAPISLKKEYPNGIKEVRLEKSAVKSIVDATRNLNIEFRDGKTVALQYYAWIDVHLNADFVSFDEKGSPQTVFYLVEDSSPEEFSVEVFGADEWVNIEIIPDKSGKGGAITFSPKVSGKFTQTASIQFSNGMRSLEIPFTIICEDFKFADGSVSKSFQFKEYERYFEIRMNEADKGVEVLVPDECRSWLQAVSSTVNVDEVDLTYICVLVSENTENAVREACLTVRREGIRRELPIEIRQIGADSPGALKKGLVEFYRALGGDRWQENENWCSDKPMFEWYGVTASNVTAKTLFGQDGFTYFGTDDKWFLELGGNNMQGTIPEEFWQACENFSSIRITYEYLAGSSLSPLVWHDELEVLDLSMTFMDANLTPAIAKTENLLYLNLQCCNVNGALPTELTGLKNLQEINLRECGVTGVIPSSIGNLTRLQNLYLDHNMELGGEMPSSIYNLENLRNLDLGSTKVGGHLSTDIVKLRNLYCFDISGCEFEGTIPEEFGTIDELSVYDFQGNYFTAIPEFVRYHGYNSKAYREWVGSAGFPLGVPFYQRDKKDGRPADYIVTVPNAFQIPDIIVDGQPLSRPGYYVDYEKCNMFPMPVWANVKYGIFNWIMYHDGEAKYPEYPYADDLQYPADEYYFDGKDWRHSKLEYPAREYWFDGKSWAHDPSCPWDMEYR